MTTVSCHAEDLEDRDVPAPTVEVPDRDEDEVLRELDRFETSTQCTATAMLASIADQVRRLFKISALIAKATTRDRHALAEAKVDCSMFRPFDAAHVQAKFSGRKVPPWMLERMTNATLKRRQYVLYTNQHHERIRDHGQEPSAAALAKSVVARTKASTLGPVDLAAPDDDFDDLQSSVAGATTVDGGDGFSRLKVPDLALYTKASEHFSCPLCHTIRRFNGQLGWK